MSEVFRDKCIHCGEPADCTIYGMRVCYECAPIVYEEITNYELEESIRSRKTKKHKLEKEY